MKNYFFTLWFSLVCIVVFVIQLLFSSFTELFVLNKSAIYNIELWRFVTSIFLHGSITHLLFNLFALVIFGLVLEKKIGSWNFLIVFFLSGIIANIISVNFYDSSLGVSGSVMGILGCLTVLSPLMMVWVYGILMPMFIAAIVWIIGDVLGIFMPSGVGNIAHLSGIGIGFIFGLFFRFFGKKEKIHTVNKENRIKIPEDYVRNWEENYVQR